MFSLAVDVIAAYREPTCAQMQANLIGATRVWFCQHQRLVVGHPHYAFERRCGSVANAQRALSDMARTARDLGCHFVLLPDWMTINARQIVFGDRSRCKLFGQRGRRGPGFRQQLHVLQRLFRRFFLFLRVVLVLRKLPQLRTAATTRGF